MSDRYENDIKELKRTRNGIDYEASEYERGVHNGFEMALSILERRLPVLAQEHVKDKKVKK